MPRLRMFAGPNGSGKSVLKSYLPEPLLGVYLNPDEIEKGVKLNGHDVDPDRVAKRYYRSLDQLLPAIRFTNRAYIFDNSTDNADHAHTWLAEITDGRRLELKTDQIPAWFKRSVLDKIA